MHNFLKKQKTTWKNAAFSLVELMVVIAIIGVLSAIAVPSYKAYVIKSNVAAGIPILTNALNSAIQQYEANGVFPTLNVYGTTLAPNPGMGNLATINVPPVIGLHYNVRTNTDSTIAMWVCVYYGNLGIPGYSAWNLIDPNSGANNRLCMLTKLVNGIYNNYCGYFPGYNDISKNYAPSDCNSILSAFHN